jgi:hypothetical protein
MHTTYKTSHTFRPKITGHERIKVYADAMQDTGRALVIPKLEITCRWMATEIRKLRNPQTHLMILGCVSSHVLRRGQYGIVIGQIEAFCTIRQVTKSNSALKSWSM